MEIVKCLKCGFFGFFFLNLFIYLFIYLYYYYFFFNLYLFIYNIFFNFFFYLFIFIYLYLYIYIFYYSLINLVIFFLNIYIYIFLLLTGLLIDLFLMLLIAFSSMIPANVLPLGLKLKSLYVFIKTEGNRCYNVGQSNIHFRPILFKIESFNSNFRKHNGKCVEHVGMGNENSSSCFELPYT